MDDLHVTAARLAVVFARSQLASALTVDEIASDAITAALAGLEAVASRHGARLVAPLDPNGMVVGLRFIDARFTCGFSHTFFVS